MSGIRELLGESGSSVEPMTVRETEAPSTAATGGWKIAGLTTTIVVLWASAFVVLRYIGPAFSPATLTFGRLLVGVVVLGVFVIPRWKPVPRHAWLPLIACGVLWFAVYNVALNAAEHTLDAGTSALLVGVAPILVAVLSALFLKERLTWPMGTGILVSFAGAAVIGFAASGSSTQTDVAGVFLALVAAASAAASIVIQKPLLKHVPALQVTWICCAIGALCTLPFSGALVGEIARASVTDTLWLVYLGAFPTAVAFAAWAYVLSQTTAAKLTATTYLVPAVAVLLSWMFLAETPGWWGVIGGALCLAGVFISRLRPRRGR